MIREAHFTLSGLSVMNGTHYRYRTPVCILYPSRIIATACFVLAQRVFDGPNSPSLDARISATSPAATLPTPPSHKPPSPDATRVVVERYGFNDDELGSIAGKHAQSYVSRWG
jgi:cyclin K